MTVGPILVASDFSQQAQVATDWAIDLAARLGVRVVVVHVFDLPILGLADAPMLVDATTAARLTDDARAALDGELIRVRGRGVEVEGVLRQGDVRQLVPQLAASEGAGLVVVGSHGRQGLARALLGSVAESIVRTSSVPVTVVRMQPR
jgi:nucleotide-binding universal stress UspA family protein